MSAPITAGPAAWEPAPVGRHYDDVVVPAAVDAVPTPPPAPEPEPELEPEPAPRQRKASTVASSKRPARGAVVTYRHPDPITGQVLEGAGVVLSTGEDGAITVAPLSQQFLEVDPENVAAADLGTEA